MVLFGPAGAPTSFYEQGHKSSDEMPAWLKNMGLTAYEYQCNRGCRLKIEKAQKIGDEALKNNIFLSIHAPYYVNLANVEEDNREKSKGYILDTMKVAKWMGAKRVVVHPGGCSKVERSWALEMAIKVLKQTVLEARELGYGDVSICPELMGKINQLGNLDEIIEMCKADESFLPTIDFGHLNAREQGALKSYQDFENVINKIENQLGIEKTKNMHMHFSRIEYTKGGEKRHWTLADTMYGPDFEPLAEVIAKKQLNPVIICESRDRMAEDALELKSIYNRIAGR